MLKRRPASVGQVANPQNRALDADDDHLLADDAAELLDALGIDDNTIVIAHADVRIKRGYPHPLQWAT